jgi:hypothetical protein
MSSVNNTEVYTMILCVINSSYLISNGVNSNVNAVLLTVMEYKRAERALLITQHKIKMFLCVINTDI